MLNKFSAIVLTWAIIMFSFSPLKIFAQTHIQGNISVDEQRLAKAQENPKPDLKKFFAKEMAKSNSTTLTETDFKRIEKENFFPKPKAQAKKKDRTVLAVVIFAVAVTVVVVLVAKYGVDNPPPLCQNDPVAGCIP